MASDFKRLLAAAADAALSDDQPMESLHRPSGNGGGKALRGLRGVAAGAVLVAAARAAAKRGPGPMSLVRHLPKPDLPDFSELTERARDLIDDWFPDESDEDFDAEGEDEDEDYEEPEADAEDEDEEPDEDEELEDDEEPEDEDYEEPEADAEDEELDDEEPEDEDYEEPEADADDEEELEDEEDEDYDVEPSERIDPPARPPRPPKRKKAKTG
jgi:hypothetical protein